MSTKTTRPNYTDPAYTDNDPRIVVALRLATEAQGRRWNFFLTGCAVESVFLSLVILSEAGFGSVAPEPRKNAKPAPTLLYIPPIRKPPPVRPPPPVVNPLASRRLQPALQDPSFPPAKVRIDMSAIQISVVDDTSNEIPAVVRQQNGRLALLDADDPSFARYTFKPPDWQMSEQIEDMSRRIRFTMTPPSQWPLLQALAASNGIKMDRFQVSAVFDGKFSDCLETEIRNHTTASSGAGQVRAVVLAFNSSRSCGIDVLNVEFAPVR